MGDARGRSGHCQQAAYILGLAVKYKRDLEAVKDSVLTVKGLYEAVVCSGPRITLYDGKLVLHTSCESPR
jgi:hypothetical protein